jgi:hypothetical protein
MPLAALEVLALVSVALGGAATFVVRVLSDRFDKKYHIDGK